MVLLAFDLDGTLADSRADMTASADRVRAELGLPARPAEAIVPWVERGMESFYRNCFDDYIADGDAAMRYERVRDAYETDYMEHVADGTRLYSGIDDALRE